MTKDKQQLSQRIAELYGVESLHIIHWEKCEFTEIWLIDDTARMFELAVENDIEYMFIPWLDKIVAGVQLGERTPRAGLKIKDHATKLEATLWAIGLALIALKESNHGK